MIIEYKKTSDLIPYVNNTRTHSDEQVNQIASSIKEFGFTNPVLLDEKDGVIAGHGRIMAAKKLSIDEIPTITLKGLTEAQIKAYIIADNKLALNAGWDEELLKLEIEALQEMQFDIDLLGFSMDELDDLGIGDVDLDLDTDKADEVPELEENPVIKLGDLIELGHNYQHRLLCGDSTSEDDVKRLMDGKKADMVFTDPPYNVDYSGAMGATSKDGKMIRQGEYQAPSTKHSEIKNDNMSDDEFESFMFKIINIIKNNTKGAWYICFGSQTIDQLLYPLRKSGMRWKAMIVWMKNQSAMSGRDYKSKYEPIAYGNFGKEFFGERYNEEDIWEFQRTLKNDLHPTMKPVPLVEKAIYNSSKTHNIVLDLFLGSGTTMIASENISRCCYGMELDEKYAQVIIQRYVDYTSNTMIKINGVEVDWEVYKGEHAVGKT
jgi:DNA modification methylase